MRMFHRAWRLIRRSLRHQRHLWRAMPAEILCAGRCTWMPIGDSEKRFRSPRRRSCNSMAELQCVQPSESWTAEQCGRLIGSRAVHVIGDICAATDNAVQPEVYVLGASNSGRTVLRFLPEDKFDTVEHPGADESGAGNGENPRPDDAAGDAPANSREAARSSDTDDGSGDGVRSADGDAEDSVHDKSEAARGFCGETAEWSQFGDALAHGLDDAPATGHGAAAHGEMAANNDPVGNGE